MNAITRPTRVVLFPRDPLLEDRARRLGEDRRRHRPRPATLDLLRQPEVAVAALPLLADAADRFHGPPLDTLKLRRLNLPTVLFSPSTGAWSCRAGYADGASILSLAMWMRGCSTLSALAFLFCARGLAREAGR